MRLVIEEGLGTRINQWDCWGGRGPKRRVSPGKGGDHLPKIIGGCVILLSEKSNLVSFVSEGSHFVEKLSILITLLKPLNFGEVDD